MIKFIELRTALQTLLKTLHARVFFNVAPDTVVFPYIVFDIPNSMNDGVLETFVIDIDVWDIEADTTALETLVGTIDNALHRNTIYIDDKMGITLHRENRLIIHDDDPRIRRRKYVYQARTYQKYY